MKTAVPTLQVELGKMTTCPGSSGWCRSGWCPRASPLHLLSATHVHRDGSEGKGPRVGMEGSGVFTGGHLLTSLGRSLPSLAAPGQAASVPLQAFAHAIPQPGTPLLSPTHPNSPSSLRAGVLSCDTRPDAHPSLFLHPPAALPPLPLP